MKINTKYTFFIFLTLVLFSCSLDDIDPTIEAIYTEPVFKISGTLNQNVLDIQAGEKDFYMYTDFEIDNSEVPTFIGRFAAEAGKTISGDEELTFYIKGAMQGSIMTPVDGVLREGDFEYSSPVSLQLPSYRYDFFSTILSTGNSGFDDSFIWNFSNGDTSMAANPTITVNSSSKFSVGLSASNDNGANSDYIGLVSPNITSDSTLLLNLSYQVEINNNEVMIMVENQGLNLSWSTGETGDTIYYNLSQLNTTGELITVTASNSYGDTALASVFVKGNAAGFPLNDVEVFTTFFNYEVTEIAAQNLGTVVIEYKKDGVTYSSNLGEQDQSGFSINSIEEFQLNENSFPTKKLQINFDCMLFNDVGESIPIEGTGFIGVAYEN